MVHGSHLIIGAYGFWLSNDPRGSWSDFVRSWELFRHGPATKVEIRSSVAASPHDRQARLIAKRSLTCPPAVFNGPRAEVVGEGFGAFVAKAGITIWACCILPEHVHLVVGRRSYKVEQIANLLKGAATRELRSQGMHPLASHVGKSGRIPDCLARDQWKVFLDSDADIRRAIAYVEQNSVKEGKRRQKWSFVREYQGLGF